jgi:hypothetical protein
VPFRRGEILESLDRRDEANVAFRRTVALDPTRAQVYYRIGRSYRALGDPQRAVFYLEQASQRFAPGSDWRQKTDWEVVKLTFPVVTESGTADGRRGAGADTVAGATREVFAATDAEVVWWGRVAGRFATVRPKITARWKDPRGAVVLEQKVEPVSGAVVMARFPLDAPRTPGAWTVEALLEDQVIDKRTFRVQ